MQSNGEVGGAAFDDAQGAIRSAEEAADLQSVQTLCARASVRFQRVAPLHMQQPVAATDGAPRELRPILANRMQKQPSNSPARDALGKFLHQASAVGRRQSQKGRKIWRAVGSWQDWDLWWERIMCALCALNVVTIFYLEQPLCEVSVDNTNGCTWLTTFETSPDVVASNATRLRCEIRVRPLVSDEIGCSVEPVKIAFIFNVFLLSIYTIELAVQILRQHRRFFQAWNIFDLLTIILSWAIPMNSIIWFRICRILRIIVRLRHDVGPVKVLAGAIAKSMHTLASVGGVVLAFFWCFGVIGIGLFQGRMRQHCKMNGTLAEVRYSTDFYPLEQLCGMNDAEFSPRTCSQGSCSAYSVDVAQPRVPYPNPIMYKQVISFDKCVQSHVPLVLPDAL
jgi:hypothetical protein